jgi:predicted lipid-binding transport protein (Tim44 family)
MKYGRIFLLYVIGSFLFANIALAGRMGGGRSFGMHRSISKSRPAYNHTAPRPAGQPAGAAPQRQRMGAGTAAMLGAAAGAAGGYMMGKSMSNNETASGTTAEAQTAEAPSNIPWGIIAILGALLVMGLMFFRKKTDPSLSGNNNSQNSYNNSQQTKFNIPNINKNSSTTGATPTASKWNKFMPNSGAVEKVEEPTRMPDGVEFVYFLRQVKGMFLHIQSMNNPDNASEVEKYMTAELFNDIKVDITNNASIADFSDLDCQLLECEEKDGQLIASVKFFGMVSEEPEQPAHPFSEIWNFVKSVQTNNRWLVAGIQQEELTK